MDPVTGFFRDGRCRPDPDGVGAHLICAVVTAEFLAHQRSIGNDLSTPRPQYGFPGLMPGDRWCVTVANWLRAHQDGAASLWSWRQPAPAPWTKCRWARCRSTRSTSRPIRVDSPTDRRGTRPAATPASGLARRRSGNKRTGGADDPQCARFRRQCASCSGRRRLPAMLRGDGDPVTSAKSLLMLVASASKPRERPRLTRARSCRSRARRHPLTGQAADRLPNSHTGRDSRASGSHDWPCRAAAACRACRSAGRAGHRSRPWGR
jgi:hypothetical protein